MAKLRTALHVQERLDDDLAWRLLDISNLRRMLSSAKEKQKETAIRAMVAMSYAHWEGFTKASAIAYGEFLSNQGLKYKQLKRNLSGLRALEHAQTLEGIRRKIFTSSRLLEELYSIESENVSIDLTSRFSRIGNLNYDLFSEIAGFFCFDVTPYETKRPFIDESLLRRRNRIAHGDYVDLDESDADQLSKEVVTLLRMLKTDIENAAALKTYLR